jgi:hypothetical protein
MTDQSDLFDRYPNTPGFVAESETSAAAAAAAEDFSDSMADRCERWFKRHTQRQQLMTCEECELAAKAAGGLGKHQSISARIRTDLYIKRGCLWKVGTELGTGKSVKVWYVTDTSNLVRTDGGRVIFRKKPNTSGRDAWVYGWGYPPSEDGGMAPP